MTTHTFKPDGRFHSESKNLRGILDNARRRGVALVKITELNATIVKVVYNDGFWSVCNFMDATICRDFFNKRWPGAIQP